MKVSEIPAWICPHCLEENEAFGEARCLHCGLHMLSNQEHRWRMEKAQPAAEALVAWSQLPEQQRNPARIQPWLDDLTPLASMQESWQEWLHPFLKVMEAYHSKQLAFQRQWKTHVLILLILILIPLVTAFVVSDWTIVLLLSLPVAGWAWIGLFEFRKNHQP